MSKKSILAFTLTFLVLLGIISFALKKADKEEPIRPDQTIVEVFFFYSRTCPYCAQEKALLERLEKESPEVKVHYLVAAEKKDMLKSFYYEYQVPQDFYGRVPITFIKEKYFFGFSEETGKSIEECLLKRIAENHQQACEDGASAGDKTEEISATATDDVKQAIIAPFIGQIDPKQYSLPLLAVVLGFFDGFNVCSLGALILILGLVLMLGSRKKMLLFGGIFILTTAIVYGLLIALWAQLFALVAPYFTLMETIIGLLGIGGGIYFIKEFIRFRKQGDVCELQTGKGVMTKFSQKMQEAFKEHRKLAALVLSVLLFAVVITVVEFPCSAVIPGFFAGHLAQANLPGLNYFIYIAIFIFFYMLDEIIVFLIAVLTMTIKIASKKFMIWLILFEAVVLFLLGFYYLFGFLIL